MSPKILISVAEAEQLINTHTAISGTCVVQNIDAEVLRQPLGADRPYPPFNRVAMDGIAIVFKKWQNGQRTFAIENLQAAGDPLGHLQNLDACMEVMTGAALPEGCDTVIRYEDLDISDGMATIHDHCEIQSGQNIHQQGVDYRRGQVLADSGELLSPLHWAVAASVGQINMTVSRRPRIALISTGNELIPVDQSPLPHQVRRSNDIMLSASLYARGYRQVERFHLDDHRETIYQRLETILQNFELVLLSGGVSMGKFDFIPQVLCDLQVDNHFYKIRQRPGKPLWFGTTRTGTTVFGLPGNPVSSLVCLHRYVLPALDASLGLQGERNRPWAALTVDHRFSKNLTCFLPVTIRYDHTGRILATPVKSNGSGDFASLTQSRGFVQLPAEQDEFLQGQAFPLFYW